MNRVNFLKIACEVGKITQSRLALGGNSYMEQMGMLVRNFEFTPKGDHLGVAQAFCDPKGDQSGRGFSRF